VQSIVPREVRRRRRPGWRIHRLGSKAARPNRPGDRIVQCRRTSQNIVALVPRGGLSSALYKLSKINDLKPPSMRSLYHSNVLLSSARHCTSRDRLVSAPPIAEKADLYGDGLSPGVFDSKNRNRNRNPCQIFVAHGLVSNSRRHAGLDV
jgi:hypothetical protein